MNKRNLKMMLAVMMCLSILCIPCTSSVMGAAHGESKTYVTFPNWTGGKPKSSDSGTRYFQQDMEGASVSIITSTPSYVQKQARKLAEEHVRYTVTIKRKRILKTTWETISTKDVKGFSNFSVPSSIFYDYRVYVKPYWSGTWQNVGEYRDAVQYERYKLSY